MLITKLRDAHAVSKEPLSFTCYIKDCSLAIHLRPQFSTCEHSLALKNTVQCLESFQKDTLLHPHYEQRAMPILIHRNLKVCKTALLSLTELREQLMFGWWQLYFTTTHPSLSESMSSMRPVLTWFTCSHTAFISGLTVLALLTHCQITITTWIKRSVICPNFCWTLYFLLS